MQNNNLLNRLKLHFLRNKSLLIATIISLLCHSLFLSEFSLTLPSIDEARQTLQMRLVSQPAIQKTTPAPVKQELPKPVPQEKPAPTVQDAPPPDTHETDPLAETPIEQPPIANTLATEQVSTAPAINDVPEPNESIADNIEIEQKPPIYQYVESEFEVRRGSDSSAAGTARIIFSIDKDSGTYSINSVTEAKGLASLFFNSLVQRSEGTVTENGLVPNFFSYEYGQKKKQSASFAWSDGVLLLQTEKGDKTEKLVAGTQDLLSFAYQFMFSPPLETMQITMTNGKTLRTYTYSFEGEEIISTKLGELKTVHILRAGGDDEKTELWLGVDYQYLPVKIRKTEKDGSVIEQIITNISTEIPQ